jgi:hypothetical protein
MRYALCPAQNAAHKNKAKKGHFLMEINAQPDLKDPFSGLFLFKY